MIPLTTRAAVRALPGESISDFMLYCTDEHYQNWWPRMYFAFHTLRHLADNIGNTVIFDELVDKHRLKFTAILTEIISGRKLVWHMLKAGYHSIGRILDPLIRLYLSDYSKRVK